MRGAVAGAIPCQSAPPSDLTGIDLGTQTLTDGAYCFSTNTITRDTCRTTAPAPTAAPSGGTTATPALVTAVPNTGVAETIDAGGDKLILVGIAAGLAGLFALTLLRRQFVRGA